MTISQFDNVEEVGCIKHKMIKIIIFKIVEYDYPHV